MHHRHWRKITTYKVSLTCSTPFGTPKRQGCVCKVVVYNVFLFFYRMESVPIFNSRTISDLYTLQQKMAIHNVHFICCNSTQIPTWYQRYVTPKPLFLQERNCKKANFEKKSITIFEGSTFHGRQNVIDVFFSFCLTRNNQERL